MRVRGVCRIGVKDVREVLGRFSEDEEAARGRLA